MTLIHWFSSRQAHRDYFLLSPPFYVHLGGRKHGFTKHLRWPFVGLTLGYSSPNKDTITWEGGNYLLLIYFPGQASLPLSFTWFCTEAVPVLSPSLLCSCKNTYSYWKVLEQQSACLACQVTYKLIACSTIKMIKDNSLKQLIIVQFQIHLPTDQSPGPKPTYNSRSLPINFYKVCTIPCVRK